MVYTGSGGVSAREQHASNVIRARYLKTQSRFDEALTVIDEYLIHVPGDGEGLFLKAQILVASAGDLALAKRCLSSVVENAPADDTYHRWAKELLKFLRSSHS